MPRLIDDLRARGARVQMPRIIAREHEQTWTGYAYQISRLLAGRDLPVLLIDNVADYYYQATDQEYWDLGKDFPNLAPPFRQFWCEHRLPRVIHSKECGDTDVSFCRGRVGALFTALAAGEFQGENIPPEVRWVLWAELFIDYGEHNVTAQGPHGSTFYAVDAEGRLVSTPWMQTMNKPGTDEIAKSLMTWYHPALLAVSFLHCKNVRLEENRVSAPLAKKYRAKHGVDPTGYKTLVIEPLKQILRTEGRAGAGNSLAKAMHICRGHFKDYREGRGLFGKYHQLVWQPQIIRGTRGEKAPAREIDVRM